MQLHLQTGCGLVVCALSLVSRPEPLKRFTYLDFIDKTKRGPAMKKLSEEIGICACVIKCTCVKFVVPSSILCVFTFRCISEEGTAKTTNKVTKMLYNSVPLTVHCRKTSSPQPYDEDEIPTPCKPDPLGLESSQSFRGYPTQTWSRPPEEETEEEDDGYYKQMEEEFEADYPTQDEQDITDREEQHEAADSDSESSSCGEVEEGEEEDDYHEPQDGGHMVAEGSQSSQRRQKRTHEDMEAEEGEVNDDSDIQVRLHNMMFSHHILCCI